jgi:hypothetical protein
MKNLKTFEGFFNDPSLPFTIFCYIPFNNKYAKRFAQLLVEKIEDNEINIKYKDGCYSLDLGIVGYDNIIFCKGIVSADDPLLVTTSYFIDKINFGALTSYFVILNDDTDDIIFINKHDGKTIHKLCENITGEKLKKQTIKADFENRTRDFEGKIKRILDELI